MGLSSSQARLLSITARMHDIELSSQDIMSRKIALATQRDDAYDEYERALDAKKLQVAFNGVNAKTTYVDATYDSVCKFNPDRSETYALKDTNTGKMIVDRDVSEAYKQFGNGDKFAFALQMIGLSQEDLIYNDESDSINIGLVSKGESDVSIWVDNSRSVSLTENTEYLNKVLKGAYGGQQETSMWVNNDTSGYDCYVIMNDLETEVYESHKDDSKGTELKSKLQAIQEAAEKGDKDKIKESIDAFRTALYDAYPGEIFDKICEAGGEKASKFDDETLAEFKYYVKLFEGIRAAGGCITVEDFSEDGNTGNEWFTNIISSGRAILSQYNDSGTQIGTWSEISPATSTKIMETEDDTDVKKAEAKYQHELNNINKKDTKFDQDLNKLETERTALKTEMDSIKKVKDENIERTFGIFS